MGIFDKIKDLAGKDKVAENLDAAIEEVGDLVDTVTGGKFADKVDQVQDLAKDKLDQAMDSVLGKDDVEAPVEEVAAEVTETPAEIVEEVTTDVTDETL